LFLSLALVDEESISWFSRVLNREIRAGFRFVQRKRYAIGVVTNADE
jgi:hypothetical protein